jgi:EAL domain-containing protein (putative c-di-GMP-specific phosphodiesterase class I)
VGVNFSTEELRSPQLVDRLAMTLDTRDIAPHRLVIEVLETVVARCADDQVARNLAGLSRLGCGIDLDDFGTGYASITNIRKLSINRIKIDRSFITRVDEDTEQQDMIAAILTMADRLTLQTLAEGVETPGERDMLTRLGCEYAQGFLFARPMPLAETDDWLATRRTAPAPTVNLRRRSA